ncbi:hypothetical protein ACLB2K_036745 [Fragaria x ananassa]
MSMTQPSQSILRPISLWVPPPVNVVKINFDGAWKESNHNSGLRVIIRRHMSVSIAGASLFRSHNSAVEAEAEALLCGVKMAMLLKLEHIIVEGDCQEVIKALNEPLASPCWRISPILKNVAHLVPLFRRIYWNWVPREAILFDTVGHISVISRICFSERLGGVLDTNFLNLSSNPGPQGLEPKPKPDWESGRSLPQPWIPKAS